MEKMSLSVRLDKGCLPHNNRKFVAKNVDANRTEKNIVFVKKDIRAMYDEIFGQALNEYNAGQTRADRIIENYYDHIANSKRENTFYEAIIQYGDCKNAACGTLGGDTATKMLTEYMRDFEKRNPQLKVFNAVLHLDEATPHLHIDFIPVAENQKFGMSTRVSSKKALEQQGVVSKNSKETERQQWALIEKTAMKKIAQKYDIEVEQKNISRPHLSVDEYKAAQKKIEMLKNQAEALTKKTENISRLSQSELDLIRNQNSAMKKEIEKRDALVKMLEGKLAARFEYIPLPDQQKLSYISSALTKKDIAIVEDAAGIYVPAWAVKLVNRIDENYKPFALSLRQKTKNDIDTLIYKSANLEHLLENLEARGYAYEIRGEIIAVRPPDRRAFIRLYSLGDEYTKQSLKKRIETKYDFKEKMGMKKEPCKCIF